MSASKFVFSLVLFSYLPSLPTALAAELYVRLYIFSIDDR